MNIEELKVLLGSDRINEDQDVIRTYSDDWTGRYKGSTSAVTFPHSTDEVSKILSWCSTNQIIKLLQKLVKQRNESAKIYKEQNRDELAEIEENQSKIISEYLPDQLDEGELINIIDEVITSTGAESIKDMGKVIGATNAKVIGRAEGRVIAELEKSILK